MKGRVAVVTGGSSGIGLACALALSKHGCSVFVGDVENPPPAVSSFVFVKTDVSIERDVERLMAAAGERVDILVNCAGVVLVKQIVDVAESEWDHVMNVNLKGVFLCCKHAIKRMQVGGGSIINISSNAGILPRSHDPVYSTSKGAVNYFTRALALSHAHQKIRVNAICPGPVSNTKIINKDLDAAADGRENAAKRFILASPLANAFGRMISPEEIADTVVFLAQSQMITGTCIAIDGAKSVGVPPPQPKL